MYPYTGLSFNESFNESFNIIINMSIKRSFTSYITLNKPVDAYSQL